MGRLNDKTAVITGGASGIGEATSRLFAAEGANVVVADFDADRGAKVAAEVGGEFVRCDVSVEADVAAAVDRAVDVYGRLDVIFNNAGAGGAIGAIDDISVEAFDDTIGVLLRGVFLGMKHAARVMKPQGSGAIISTASVAGLQAGFGPAPYSAAKAGVVSLTKSAAVELGEFGIRANCICPGGIATNIFARGLGVDLDSEMAGQVRDFIVSRFANLQPIRRTGMPDDIAQTVLFLASDAGSFVSGQAIVVDGGLTAGRSMQSMFAEGGAAPTVPGAIADAIANADG